MVKSYYVNYVNDESKLKEAIGEIGALNEITSIEYNSFQQKIKVTVPNHLTEKEILRDITEIIHNHDPEIEVSSYLHKSTFSRNKYNFIFFGIGIIIFLLSVFLVPKDFKWISYTISILLGSKILLHNVYKSIKKKEFSESMLIFIAVLGASLLHSFIVGYIVLTIYTAANILVKKATNFAKRDVIEMLEEVETDVYRLTGDAPVAVSIKSIEVGDTIAIRSGEIIPLEGIIVKGESKVDISGISNIPEIIEVEPGMSVGSGGKNVGGPIHIAVTSIYNEGVLHTLIQKTDEAIDNKARIVSSIERAGSLYVKIIGIVALLIIVVGNFAGDGFTLSNEATFKGLILFAISCPWAFMISVPVVYNMALGLGKKKNILIKNGNVLNQLGKLKTLFVTSTGILTSGNFSVKEIYGAKGVSQNEVLTAAAIGEFKAKHPIGIAIKKKFGKSFEAKNFISYEEYKTKGCIAIYKESEIIVGTDSFMEEQGIVVQIILDEHLIHVALDKKYLGAISVEDELKEDGKKLIDDLNLIKLDRVSILTGQRSVAANDILGPIKTRSIYSELNIEDKANKIKKEKKRLKNNTVGFVGDSIADGPIMAASNVSFAFMKGNLDRITKISDVIFLEEDLDLIRQSIILGKSSHRIIKQNMFLAIIIKLILIIYILTNKVSLDFMIYAIVIDLVFTLIAVLNGIRVSRKIKKDINKKKW